MTTRPQDGCENDHPSNNQVADEWGSSRYQPVEQIGVGAYGVVYKAKDTSPDATDTNTYVAMKCLRVENTEQGMPLSTVREIALLKQLETLEHPNVVRLLDVCTGRQTVRETQLMLVFEHVNQDLDMFLKSAPESGLEDEKIRDIMYQLLTGLDFLHSMRVIHRDLKPQNVLITESGQIKIADFGLARIYSFDMALTAVVVTLWYRAPEVLLQDSYASPVDLWSIGCIFAELFNRKPLFRGTGDVNQLKKIFEFIGRPSEDNWPHDVAMPFTSFPPQEPRSPLTYVPRLNADAAAFLMKLLSFKPSQRPTAKEALKETYFKDVLRTPSEPSLFSSEINQAMTYTRGVSTSTSGRGRMPYAMEMTRGQAHSSGTSHVTRVHDVRYADEEGHEGYDCPDSAAVGVSRSSTITPGLEQVTTTDEPLDPPSQPPSRSRSRPRAFGDLLPLDSRDGASGARQRPSLSPSRDQESAFLTPPSDIASSTSSGFMTSSSSRSSSTSSENHASKETSTSSREAALQSEAKDPGRAITGPDTVQRRAKTDESSSSSSHQSRMSWTTDPLPDHSGQNYNADRVYYHQQLQGLPDEGVFKTPVHQRVPYDDAQWPDVGCVRPSGKSDSRDSALPSGGHSSQCSLSSTEGEAPLSERK